MTPVLRVRGRAHFVRVWRKRRSIRYGVGDRPVTPGMARPVFVVLRPPHTAAKPTEGGEPWDAPGGRSRVAGSSFNGGWRWWLAVACCVLAIVEGWFAIALGAGIVGG